jgi:hypothetical protein
MYTVLIGRAGIGKGMAMGPITDILGESGAANILSDRLTMEYILERLSKGFPHTSNSPSGSISIGLDSSATIISPELSILITASLATLPVLCDLWDARDRAFSYGTRHKGEYKIDKPCLSLLGASTPEWLISSIPSNAIGGGFTRRVNFVFGKDRSKNLPWPSFNHSGARSALIEDLRHIGQLQGEYSFAPLAKPIFERLYQESTPDDYDDEATTAYKTSKWAHATKLAIVLAASKRDQLVIEEEDIRDAEERINEISKDVPMVFRAVGESDLVAAADRILRFIEARGYASKDEIMRTNWRHVSLEDLDRILAAFLEGHLIVESSQGGKRTFKAVPQVKSKPSGGGP